jgi:hypothetical protein
MKELTTKTGRAQSLDRTTSLLEEGLREVILTEK